MKKLPKLLEFDTFIWPIGTVLQNFGIKDQNVLVNHYKHKLASEREKNMFTIIMGKWYELKVGLIGQKPPLPDLLTKTVSLGERFHCIKKLIALLLQYYQLLQLHVKGGLVQCPYFM